MASPSLLCVRVCVFVAFADLYAQNFNPFLLRHPSVTPGEGNTLYATFKETTGAMREARLNYPSYLAKIRSLNPSVTESVVRSGMITSGWKLGLIPCQKTPHLQQCSTL